MVKLFILFSLLAAASAAFHPSFRKLEESFECAFDSMVAGNCTLQDYCDDVLAQNGVPFDSLDCVGDPTNGDFSIHFFFSEDCYSNPDSRVAFPYDEATFPVEGYCDQQSLLFSFGAGGVLESTTATTAQTRPHPGSFDFVQPIVVCELSDESVEFGATSYCRQCVSYASINEEACVVGTCDNADDNFPVVDCSVIDPSLSDVLNAPFRTLVEFYALTAGVETDDMVSSGDDQFVIEPDCMFDELMAGECTLEEYCPPGLLCFGDPAASMQLLATQEEECSMILTTGEPFPYDETTYDPETMYCYTTSVAFGFESGVMERSLFTQEYTRPYLGTLSLIRDAFVCEENADSIEFGSTSYCSIPNCYSSVGINSQFCVVDSCDGLAEGQVVTADCSALDPSLSSVLEAPIPDLLAYFEKAAELSGEPTTDDAVGGTDDEEGATVECTFTAMVAGGCTPQDYCDGTDGKYNLCFRTTDGFRLSHVEEEECFATYNSISGMPHDEATFDPTTGFCDVYSESFLFDTDGELIHLVYAEQYTRPYEGVFSYTEEAERCSADSEFAYTFGEFSYCFPPYSCLTTAAINGAACIVSSCEGLVVESDYNPVDCSLIDPLFTDDLDNVGPEEMVAYFEKLVNEDGTDDITETDDDTVAEVTCGFDSMVAGNCTLDEYCNKNLEGLECSGDAMGEFRFTEVSDEECFADYETDDVMPYDAATFDPMTGYCATTHTSFVFGDGGMLEHMEVMLKYTRPYTGTQAVTLETIPCDEPDGVPFGSKTYCLGTCFLSAVINGKDCIVGSCEGLTDDEDPPVDCSAVDPSLSEIGDNSTEAILAYFKKVGEAGGEVDDGEGDGKVDGETNGDDAATGDGDKDVTSTAAESFHWRILLSSVL